MLKTFRIILKPTEDQEAKLWDHVVMFRQVWNWALGENMKRFENHEKHLSSVDLGKLLTQEKKKEERGLWRNTSSQSAKIALRDLELSYHKFFAYHRVSGRTKFAPSKIRSGKKLTPYDMVSHPRFKSCNKAKPAFAVRADAVYFDKSTVNIEKIGKVQIRTNYAFSEKCKVYNPRVSCAGGKWLLTFSVDVEPETEKKLNDYSLGIDLGIKELAVVSCNQQEYRFKNVNKEYRVVRLKKQLKHAQRTVSRRYEAGKRSSLERCSNRHKKAKKRVSYLYRRLANIRRDYTHKVTRFIVNLLPSRIVMEDLSIKGTMKNQYLARSISECCWADFVRQIRYKAEWLGIDFVAEDRFFPSSKKCSACGAVKKSLKLSERVYCCDSCGLVLDRDTNAARNHEQYKTT